MSTTARTKAPAPPHATRAPAPKVVPAAPGPVDRGPTALGATGVPVQFQLSEPDAAVQLECGCSGSCSCGWGAPATDEDAPGPGGFQLNAAGAPQAAPRSAHSIAKSGVSGASDPLPFGDRIQASFGRHDVSGVRTRTGGRAGNAARALGANAYARSSDIGFRSAPDLHLAAHEAAHTVQQRRGVKLKGGVGQPGDPYEQQADAVADAVVAGGSAEALLDQDPGGGGAGGMALQKDCGCGGTCASCQGQTEDGDALQMELSVTPAPGSETDETPAEEATEDAGTDAVADTVAAGEDSAETAQAASEEEADVSAGPQDDAAPQAAEEDAQEEDEDSAGGAPDRAASTAIPAGETDAPAADTDTAETTDTAVQMDGCGPTTEPQEEEEVEEPPPGEVNETAEGEGPAADDAPGDPDAVQNAMQEAGAGDGAEGAADTLESTDPGAAETAMLEEAGGELTGTATADPAVAAGPDLSSEMAQVEGTRAMSVAGYHVAQAGLGEARGAAAQLGGMNASFGAGDGGAREDLQAASARLQGMLGRASSSIVAESIAIEAQILAQTEAALESAKASVTAATTVAQAMIVQGVTSAKMRVTSDAAAQRAIVTGQMQAAIAGIDAQAATATALIDAADISTAAQIGVAQAAQTAPVTAAFATGDRQVRDAGTEVGQEAMDIATRYKTAYEQDRKVSGGECVEDSWYDGCLCDRRARARMTAAQTVGEGFRDGLVAAANGQADEMRQGIGQTFADIAARAEAARTQATAQATSSRATIEARRAMAVAAVTAAHVSTNAQISATEATTLANLDAHMAAQIGSLAELGFVQIATLEETAHAAAAAALGAVTTAIQAATSGVAMAVSGLTAGPPPPEEELAGALAALEGMLDGALAELAASNQAALASVATRIAEGAAQAQLTIAEAQTSALDQATQMADSASQAMVTSATMTVTSMTTTMSTAIADMMALAQAGQTALAGIVTSLSADYATVIGGIAASFTSASENLKTALRAELAKMETGPDAIPTKAREAASKEKPAWLSVLKWVLIIAIVIFVTVVAGPAVIGLLGGASSLFAVVAGGAILGAVTGGTIQVVNNVFDGNPWHQGVVKAVAIGFVTGALGGAVGFGIGQAFNVGAVAGQQVTRTLGSKALEFGANLAADAGMEIGQQLIETGTVDWQNFGIAMAFSVGTAGLGAIPKVADIQGNIGNAVSARVRGPNVNAPDVNVRADVDPPARIDADVSARAADVDGPAPRAPDADSAPGAPARPADADADAPSRAADADDANNTRVEDDGSVRDGNLSDVSTRAAADPDAPRLDAEPDTPARARSDAELAEASQPVRMDGEDHTLVPRRWIDGEIRLFMCSDCGPVMNKIDEVTGRTTDPTTRAQLESLRAEVADLEASFKNGSDTAEMRTRLEEIAADVNRIEASTQTDADANAPTPPPQDADVNAPPPDADGTTPQQANDANSTQQQQTDPDTAGTPLAPDAAGPQLPPLPDGYHYREVNGEVHVSRNPGRAGDLPQMHLDNGNLVPGPKPSAPRSMATRAAFLRSQANNPNVPSHLKPWLRRGQLPPGYTVHHRKALYDGGTDSVDNMVLQGVDLHRTTHRYYRPGGRVPSINPPHVTPY